MAQLDQFVKALLSQPEGAEMRLAADAEPCLRLGDKTRPMIAKKLTAAHIRFLMGEIASDDVKTTLEERGFAEFIYSPPGLPQVTVTVKGWMGVTDVVFRAVEGGLTSPDIAAPRPVTSPRGSIGSIADTGSVTLDAASPPTSGVTPIGDLFRLMVKMGASDLHLSTGEKPMVRKDGDMQRFEHMPVLTHQSIAGMVLPLLPDRARLHFEQTNDADFAYEIEGLSRFRGNIFRDRKGVCAVFRTIPTEIVSAEKLGLPPALQNLCYLSKGLVLVTGPTGSGKSTTLAALVDLINRKRHDHIITIEDPIEFVHPNKKCLINQREVHTHTESFKAALRAALREDPDIVLVGELRDLETVAIAIETAETGHLVFGTLHTTTAASTVDRVIDQFPADRQAQIRIMLSESLKGVIAQTLCRKIGGGRVAALEVLIVTQAVSNLIREGKTFQLPSIMQVNKAAGMVSLNDALIDLVNRKLVDPAEAYAKAVDKGGLDGLLKRAGFNVGMAPAPVRA